MKENKELIGIGEVCRNKIAAFSERSFYTEYYQIVLGDSALKKIKEAVSETIKLLKSIDIYNTKFPYSILPKNKFNQLISSTWIIFVGMQIVLNKFASRDKCKEIDYLKKVLFPLFQETVDCSLQALSGSNCPIKEPFAINRYLLMLQKYDYNTIFKKNLIYLDEIAKNLNEIAPNYHQTSINIYYLKLAKFQAFGISDYDFKCNFCSKLEKIIDKIYRPYNRLCSVENYPMFFDSDIYYLICLWEMMLSTPKPKRDKNQSNGYIFILRKILMQIKWLVDKEDIRAINLMHYFKEEVRSKIAQNTNLEDIRDILESMQLIGINFYFDKQTLNIFNCKNNDEFESVLRNNNLIKQYSSLQIYEHYFSWSNTCREIEDHTIQFKHTKNIIEKLLFLQSPIFLEVLMLIAIKNSRAIAKYAFAIFEKRLNQIKPECDMSYICLLSSIFLEDLMSTNLKYKIIGLAIREKQKSEFVVIKKQYKHTDKVFFLIKSTKCKERNLYHIHPNNLERIQIEEISDHGDTAWMKTLGSSDNACIELFDIIKLCLCSYDYNRFDDRMNLLRLANFFRELGVTNHFMKHLHQNVANN